MGSRYMHFAIVSCAVALGASADVHANTDERPWLGVGIQHGSRGVMISEVIRDTPAEEAGLLVGDEIFAVQGSRVKTPSELNQEIVRHRIADRVVVEVWRGRKRVSMPVVLGPRLGPDEILHRRYVGLPSPGFDAEIVYGSDSGRSADLRGQIVVLQLFSSSCEACLEQHSRLSRLADEYAGRGLVVLAINGSRRVDVAAWAARTAPSFSVGYDPMGMVFRSFRVDGSEPVLVVLDGAGVVRYAGIGGAENLDRAIETVALLRRSERRVR